MLCCLCVCRRHSSVLRYFFFFQAEDGIRDLVRSRGLGDVYKRQRYGLASRSFLGATVDLEETYAWGQEELARITDDLSLIHI